MSKVTDEQKSDPAPATQDPPTDPDVERATSLVKLARYLWGFKLWIGGLATLGTSVWGVITFVETVPGWMVGLAVAAGVLPIVGGLRELRVWLAAQNRRRQRKEYGLEKFVAKSGYFRFSPWQDTQIDQDRFQRADGLHLRITDWLRQPPEALLYLTGASGSGKSSLLNSAVLPALRERSKDCVVSHSVVLRGFDDPLQELCDWLLQKDQPWADSEDKPDDTLSRKRKPHTLLAEVCQRLEERHPDERLLIVFDQFEELIILHNVNSERVQQVRDFLHELVSSPPTGLTVLLTLRSDYEDQLEELGLPAQVQNRNWRKVGYFTLGQAEQFLTTGDAGIQPGEKLLSAVLQEAAEVDDTPGRTKPVVINMLGLMLQRLHGVDPSTLDRGVLLPRFVRMGIEAADVRDVSGLILKEMLQQDSPTRLPATVGHLAGQTALEPTEIQDCLNRLGDADRQLVRPIIVKARGDGPQPVEERLWEISHDFIARLLGPILETPRRTWRERMTPLITPGSLTTSLVLLVLLGLFHMATWQTRIREQRIREQLRDEHSLVLNLRDDGQSWRAIPVQGTRDQFTLKPESIQLLIRHGNVGELDLSRDIRRSPSPSDSLTTVPDLTGLTSLQTLDLSGCAALTTVPDLTGLTSLQSLDLTGCDALTTIPELTGLTASG